MTQEQNDACSRWVAEKNIERFCALLRTDLDPDKREILKALLEAETNKLTAILSGGDARQSISLSSYSSR